jgi:hypothetical protein
MGLLAWILIGGGAVYLFNLKNAGEKISITVLNISGIRFSFGAVTVTANVAIDNPTATSFKIRKPTLKLIMNGDEIGNSIPDGTEVEIRKGARTVINDMNIQVPYLNLSSGILEIVKNGFKGKTITIVTNTMVNGIPYESEDEFEL